MRIGILADVHANPEALDAAIADGEGKVDEWWFIGDVLGRGPLPIPTLERLRRLIPSHRWLTGNHDLAVTARIPTEHAANDELLVWANHRRQLRAHKPNGWPSLWRWCRRNITPEHATARHLSHGKLECWAVHAALGDLPMNIGSARFARLLPWVDVDSRVLRDEQLGKLVALGSSANTTVLIHGHTHIPYSVAQPADYSGHILMPISYEDPQELHQYKAWLINPGSVGQPRNPDVIPHAAYGILDSQAQTFEFRRVEYDPEATIRDLGRLGYPIHLSWMLEGAHKTNPLWQKNQLWIEWCETYIARSWGWEPIAQPVGPKQRDSQ